MSAIARLEGAIARHHAEMHLLQQEPAVTPTRAEKAKNTREINKLRLIIDALQYALNFVREED